jgi:hypothetical protein
MYRVPSSNRFAGATPGVDEIYAFGLRNPYRISFDRTTGKLYAADVGQDAREEIDVIKSGGNYGWVLKEGTLDNTNIGGSYTVMSTLLRFDPSGMRRVFPLHVPCRATGGALAASRGAGASTTRTCAASGPT